MSGFCSEISISDKFYLITMYNADCTMMRMICSFQICRLSISTLQKYFSRSQEHVNYLKSEYMCYNTDMYSKESSQQTKKKQFEILKKQSGYVMLQNLPTPWLPNNKGQFYSDMWSIPFDQFQFRIHPIPNDQFQFQFHQEFVNCNSNSNLFNSNSHSTHATKKHTNFFDAFPCIVLE